MKETKKLIALTILFSILLIVLLGVVIVKHNETRRLEEKTENQRFVVSDVEDLKILTISGPDNEKTVYYLDEYATVMKIIHNDAEFANTQLNHSWVDDWVDQILHFSIDNRIDSQVDNMSTYGLDDPKYTIAAEKKDGSSTVVYIGNVVPSNNGIYVKSDREDKVFVAPYSLYKCLTSNFENNLNRIVLSLERSEVNEICFERTSTKDRWVAKPLEDYDNGIFIEPRYIVTYPMQREPNNSMYDLLASILQFQVTQYFPIAEEDMASYGLSDPEYKITIRLKTGEVIKIDLSMELGGYYYGRCSSNPYTFRVDPVYLYGMNNSSFELIDSYVIHGYLDDVSTVQATIKDKTFMLECRMNQALDFTADDSVFQLDQRNAKIYSSDGDCYGLLLFASIFNMPVSRVDYDIKPELKNVEASFHVVKHSGEIVDLKLVPSGDTEFYCFINDYYSGFIVDRSVLYKDNGYVLSDFGVWDAYCLATEAIDNKNKNDVYNRP